MFESESVAFPHDSKITLERSIVFCLDLFFLRKCLFINALLFLLCVCEIYIRIMKTFINIIMY